VDVYSFGLLLYTLLTEKLPYTEAKTIEELKKLIEEPVKLDTTLYPPSLADLIASCLNKDPTKRPNFVDLTSDTCWQKIYQDMVSAGNKAGQEIWLLASKKKEGVDSIPWDEFAPVLWKELDITSPEPIQEECVRTMLYLENKNVLHKNWIRFLTWFAPLRTGKDGKEFVKKVEELLQSKWFYGREFDRVMADTQINETLKNKTAMDKNKGKLPFLVRIAISQNEKFCLVYAPGQPNTQIPHVPINPTDYVDVGISKFINDMAKKRNWFPTADGRPFETQIFSKIETLQSTDMREKAGEHQTKSVIQPNSIVNKTKYI